MKRKKIPYCRILVYSILAIELLAIIIYFAIGQSHPEFKLVEPGNGSILLCDDWTIYYEDGTSEMIELPTNIQSDIEVIRISRLIPKDMHNKYIMIWNKGHNMKVYVDGTLRKTTDKVIHRLINEPPPYYYEMVELMDSDSGKILELEFTTFNEGNRELGEVYIGEKTALIVTLLSGKHFGIFLSFVMILFGGFALVVTIVMSFIFREVEKLIYLELGVILTSLWFLFNLPVAQLVIYNVSSARDIAFFIPPVVMAVFSIYVNQIQKERYGIILYTLIFVCFAVNMITMVGAIVFKIPLNVLFILAEIVMACGILVFFGTILKDLIEGYFKNYLLYGVGLIGLAVGCMIYIIQYALFPYSGDSGMMLLASVLFMLIIAIIAMVKDIKDIYVDKIQAQNALTKMSRQAMESLARTVDAKDKYTNGHSNRVALYAVKLAKAMGYKAEEVGTLKSEALLHDIGKIGIPDSVLNKPDRLTDIEFSIMKSHTTLGEDILKDMIQMPNACVVAGQHHERYDGKGYPLGLSGNEIHPHARIVCIADSFDAMSSDRVYRKALTSAQIRDELLKGRGTQFDPEYLDVFLDLFESGKLNIHRHYESDESVQKDEILEELHKVYMNLTPTATSEGAFYVGYQEFSKLYDYTIMLKKRYNHTFELAIISLERTEGMELTEADIQESSLALELAIKKNIRTVDIYTKYNNLQHILLFIDAGMDNIDIIIQRIYLEYYKLYTKKNVTLSYQSGER